MGDVSALRPAAPPLLGVVCGLRSEAKLLARWAEDPRVRIEIAGADAARARDAAARLADAGARALLSFGLAGGLDPALAPGDALIVRETVHHFDGRAYPLIPLDIRGVAIDRIAHADAIVDDPKHKAAIRDRSGAAAVDMETFVTAEIAAARGLPAYALRAVADPADRALPAAALSATTPEGDVDLKAVLAGLARAPGQLPGLIALGRDAARAEAALKRSVGLVLPLLLTALAEPAKAADSPQT